MKTLARSLRKNQTDAERIIWNQLRNRQIQGCKFRRQQVIGPYIADFLCMEPKLIIEIDGEQHLNNQNDVVRSQYLNHLATTYYGFGTMRSCKKHLPYWKKFE